MDVLTLSHVSKSFGSKKVLDDLSFSVPEHTIFGFIGQNGAGKTTTMKLILGLLQMDDGVITVHGQPVQYGQNQTNQWIGYLPDVPEFYGFMTPVEYLTLCGDITGMAKDKLQDKILELLELVGLSKDKKRRMQGFSRGMRQRLGIAQALLNEPKLLICDEPTSALDPVGRKEILDILLSVKEHTTVVFSTHILSDVEKICDKIAFLHNGKIALHGTLEDIHKLHQSSGFEVEFFTEQECDLFLKAFPDGKRMSRTNLVYHQKTKEDMSIAMEYIVKTNSAIKKIELLEPSLEDLFMEVTKQ